MHNPATGEYVLWWNYVHPNGTYAGFAAATAADSPVGPFTQRVASVNITYQRADVQAGDFKLFVDPDDGAGYGARCVMWGWLVGIGEQRDGGFFWDWLAFDAQHFTHHHTTQQTNQQSSTAPASGSPSRS